jgi:hypothetical protein
VPRAPPSPCIVRFALSGREFQKHRERNRICSVHSSSGGDYGVTTFSRDKAPHETFRNPDQDGPQRLGLRNRVTGTDQLGGRARYCPLRKPGSAQEILRSPFKRFLYADLCKSISDWIMQCFRLHADLYERSGHHYAGRGGGRGQVQTNLPREGIRRPLRPAGASALCGCRLPSPLRPVRPALRFTPHRNRIDLDDWH